MAALWGLFVPALAWFVGVFLGPMVFRIFWTVGIGFVAFQGLQVALDGVEVLVAGHFQSMGGVVGLGIYAVSLLKLDIAASMIFSALGFRVLTRLAGFGLRVLDKGV